VQGSRGFNSQFWAIMGIGIALGALMLQQSSSVRADIADLQQRLTRVETTLNLIVQGLHIELRGGAE